VSEPLVDVVVPLHRRDRDISTAVRSAHPDLQGVATRVTVVLHDLEADRALRDRIGPDARVLECRDGIPSPSGPRNVGLAAATAPFVFFLDSDDSLAPACLARLHEVARDTSADVVLPSIRRDGRYVGTPLVVSRRARILDPAAHQLFLRSHVPALLRRSALDDAGIRYPGGIRSGEDFVVMSRLFATARAALAFDAVYEVHDSGDARASVSPLPPGEQLAAVRLVLGSPWVSALPDDRTTALVRRILAVNLASGWRTKRGLGQEPAADEHREVRELARATGPRAEGLLSVRDRVSLRFELAPGLASRLLQSRPFGLIPSSWRGLASGRGPFVTELRSFLVRHRRRRPGASAP